MSSASAPTFLGIDTSGVTFSVALAHRAGDTFTIAESIEGEGRRAHEILAEEVAALIARHGASLDEILLGAGPGSFTGLRVGYAFAKGLASGTKSALGARCSLAACAGAHLRRDGVGEAEWSVVADAGRSELFFVHGNFRGGRVETASEGEIVSLAHAIEKAHEVRKRGGIALARSAVEGAPEDLLVVCQGVTAEGLFLVRSAGMTGASVYPGEERFAALAPRYVRQVAAKTIAERVFGAQH